MWLGGNKVWVGTGSEVAHAVAKNAPGTIANSIESTNFLAISTIPFSKIVETSVSESVGKLPEALKIYVLALTTPSLLARTLAVRRPLIVHSNM